MNSEENPVNYMTNTDSIDSGKCWFGVFIGSSLSLSERQSQDSVE